MKRLAVVCLVLGLAMGFVRVANAWLVDTEVKTDVNSNSQNKYSSENDNSIHDSRINVDRSNKYTNSNNRTDSHNDNRKFDYKYDYSVKDSFNTDNRAYDLSDRSDRSVKDSYNTTLTGNTFTDDHSIGKRTASHDIGGGVSNSIIGDFNQTVGTTNTQTFGDVNISGSSDK